MSDGPPDISRFLLPAVGAVILAGIAGFVSETPIVAAVAGFVGWRLFSGSVKARDPEHASPEPNAEIVQKELKVEQRSGGAGSGADSNSDRSTHAPFRTVPTEPGLTSKLEQSRDSDNSDDSGSRKRKSRPKTSQELQRAESKLTKATARKAERDAMTKAPSTAGTSTGTIQRQVKPAADPNLWWLEAFAKLDASMAHGHIDEIAYDREYERIVRRRDAEFQDLEIRLD